MNTSKLKENMLALFFAGILALVVVFFINNTKFLQADIIWGQSQKSSEWDVSYSIDDKWFVVTSQKDVNNIKAISIMVMFDKEKVKINKTDIKTNYDFTLSDAWEGAMNIMLQNVSKLKAWDNLLTIGLDGKKEINLSEIFVNFADGWQDVLSITKK